MNRLKAKTPPADAKGKKQGRKSPSNSKMNCKALCKARLQWEVTWMSRKRESKRKDWRRTASFTYPCNFTPQVCHQPTYNMANWGKQRHMHADPSSLMWRPSSTEHCKNFLLSDTSKKEQMYSYTFLRGFDSTSHVNVRCSSALEFAKS